MSGRKSGWNERRESWDASKPAMQALDTRRPEDRSTGTRELVLLVVLIILMLLSVA